MSTEEWRPIAGFPNYRVSSQGRVLSFCWKKEGAILGGGLNIHGYRHVHLGRFNRRSVHRLVAEAFIGPCPPGLQVRHLDGDKTNNSAENLAYGTQSDNEKDKIRHGTHAKSKTHCIRGHAFADTKQLRPGRRTCRPCARENERCYRERRAARVTTEVAS